MLLILNSINSVRHRDVAREFPFAFQLEFLG